MGVLIDGNTDDHGRTDPRDAIATVNARLHDTVNNGIYMAGTVDPDHIVRDQRPAA